jgi:hypothetical protein
LIYVISLSRKTAKGLIAGEGPVWVPQTKFQGGDAPETADDAEGASASCLGAIERLSLKEDEAYFTGYADFNIHAEMLQVCSDCPSVCAWQMLRVSDQP